MFFCVSSGFLSAAPRYFVLVFCGFLKEPLLCNWKYFGRLASSGNVYCCSKSSHLSIMCLTVHLWRIRASSFSDAFVHLKMVYKYKWWKQGWKLSGLGVFCPAVTWINAVWQFLWIYWRRGQIFLHTGDFVLDNIFGSIKVFYIKCVLI